MSRKRKRSPAPPSSDAKQPPESVSEDKTRTSTDKTRTSTDKTETSDAKPTAKERKKFDWAPFLRRLALTTLSGVLLFLSFPTHDLWPLIYFTLPLLLFAIHDRTPKQAFMWGMWMGAVTNIGGFWWISVLLMDFAHMNIGVAVAICVLMNTIQGLVFALWASLLRWAQVRHFPYPLWSIGIPIMLALEFIFPMLFPWYMGNSQYLFYPAVQIAEIFGILGVSMLVLLVNFAIWEAASWYVFKRDQPFPWRFVVGALVVYGLCLMWGQMRMNEIDAQMADAETMRIGLVEANIGIWEKEDPDKLDNNILIHQNLSAQLGDVDLVVWPESSYQSPYIWGSTAQTTDTTFLELDSLFVPEFRDGILPAVRAMEVGFGRHLHHIPDIHRLFHVASARVAFESGYKAVPASYPVACGPKYETHLRCPFRRIPPDDVTYLLPGREPLQPDKKADRRAGTMVWNQLAVQRGFDAPLLFGGLTIRAPEGTNLSYRELLRAKRSERQLFNVALLADAEGRVLGNYKKVFLLLFGESIPFADKFPWIYDVIPEAGSFTAGEEPDVFELNGHRIGLMICYEDILPSFSRQLAQLEPQVIINVTNDAWFGKTSEPYLHMALATTRAVETRAWLIRSTNTGVSVFVDANGRIVSETDISDPEILVEDVPMMSGEKTIYTRIGDVLGWFSLFILAVVLALGRGGFTDEPDATI